MRGYRCLDLRLRRPQNPVDGIEGFIINLYEEFVQQESCKSELPKHRSPALTASDNLPGARASGWISAGPKTMLDLHLWTNDTTP